MRSKKLFILSELVLSSCFQLLTDTRTQHEFKNKNLKYILMWTQIYHSSILMKIIPDGQSFFVQKDCPYKNCYFSWEGDSEGVRFFDVTDYDAILFHGPLFTGPNFYLPDARLPNQLYIFIDKEAPGTHPVCEPSFDGLFNMTFTYRLDSEIKYYYLVVKDKTGKVIGPSTTIQWMTAEDMLPIGNDIKEKLKWKYKAAAWFASHCNTSSGREFVVKDLQEELNQYNLFIDIYGKCGNKHCGLTEARTMKVDTTCWRMIQTEYFFYLSFENDLAVDYVTEKLLNPLLFYTVPIVYGGANYDRFIPRGMYLDATKLTAKELAKEMYEIINNKSRYYSFFKWNNHYSYHESYEDADTDPFCQLCAKVNDNKSLENDNVYNNFIEWWHGPDMCSEEGDADFNPNEKPWNILRIL